MNTNKQTLRLPRELKDLEKIQNSHHSGISQNIGQITGSKKQGY